MYVNYSLPTHDLVQLQRLYLPEPQLDLGGEPVWLEGERVLDVALRVERRGHRLVRAVLPRPAGVALARGLPERAHACAVLPAPRPAGREVGVAGVLGGEAARLGVAEEARLGQVVQLRVVHDVPGGRVQWCRDS